MAFHLAQRAIAALGELRYQPTDKHVRALLGGSVLVDSRRARLVWEPSRLVASYAVPIEDVRAELEPAAAGDQAEYRVRVTADGPGLLDPRTGFTLHTTPGTALSLRAGNDLLEGAGFRPDDPDLAGYVVLDFAAFDEWLEEEEPIVAHPRDPYHRVDVRRSARHVRLELAGEVLAESNRPRMLFETMLPPRYYLPYDDVRSDLLTPSQKVTQCAYKGAATYWSAEAMPDIAWTYRQPLPDSVEVRDLVGFFDERLDVYLDGELRERPVTPWS